MPIYEYRCTKCDQITSELRSMSQREEPIECPLCKGTAEVIISAIAAGSSECGGCTSTNCGPT